MTFIKERQMYNPSSPYAQEFINHEEIMESLQEAKKESRNPERVAQILEKAALLKGLTHREAAILMDCNDPALEEKIYALAASIKQRFYGNRIVLFAPLYLIRISQSPAGNSPRRRLRQRSGRLSAPATRGLP